MDGIGSLQLAWTKGYKGSQAEYINQEVICFKCGDTIKFVGEDGHETLYTSSGESIGPLAVHSINKLFAYSENAIKPKIFVLQYPSFLSASVLSDGAQLEYISLNFSSSDHLASISGVPEYQLIIWKYTDKTKLYVQDLPNVTPNGISFNPGNWRQLAICTEKELTIWNVEQNNNNYIMKKQKVKLPADGINSGVSTSRQVSISRASSRIAKLNLQLPSSAIAGLTGEDIVKFEEYQDDQERMVPISLTWMPSGDLIVGCKGGQLLKIDGEDNSLIILSTEKSDEHEDIKGQHHEDKHEDIKHQHHEDKHEDIKHQHHEDKHEEDKTSKDKHDDKHQKDKTTKDEHREDKEDEDKYDENKSPEMTKGHHHEHKATSNIEVDDAIVAGSVNCLALHRRGLFAAGHDGVIRLLQIKKNSYYIKEHYRLNTPITSISFNPSHHKLAVGSTRGSLHLCNPDAISDTSLLFDVHFGNFLNVCSLASSSSHCVTLRESGQVQVWDVDAGQLKCSMSIGVKACSLATSPLVHIAVVGAENGHAFVLDLNQLDHPRIIYSIHLHQAPVRFIAFNEIGKLFLTGSSDGNIFVLDGRPSKHFEPLGFISCPGDVKGLATYLTNGSTKVVVTLDNSDSPSSKSPANKLISFTLPADLQTNLTKYYASPKCDFKDDSINKLCFNFVDPVFGVTLTDDNYIYVLSQFTKHLQKIQVPHEAPKKEKNKDPYLVVSEQVPGHQLPGGHLSMSLHHKWLATGGGDGRVAVRELTELDSPLVMSAHNYWKGGILDFSFSPDAQFIFTTGFDGTLCCLRWNFSSSGHSRGRSAAEAAASLIAKLHDDQIHEDRLVMQITEWTGKDQSVIKPEKERKPVNEELEIETSIENDQLYSPSSPLPPEDATWLEIKKIQAYKEEDKKFADEKMKLRVEIREMRRKLLQMMRENETVPQIEKLPHHEFDLDVDEQKRLQEQCEIEVQKIREDKEFQNIAKMYLTEIIRKECWDDMTVKGRGICSFNSILEVYNYPMKERIKQELRELEVVKAQRRVEIAELEARKVLVDSINRQPKESATAEDEVVETEELKQQWLREKSALMGSLGAEVGGDNDLFYSQFELVTREQKQNQIVLLQDAICRIKEKYNKEFDEVFQKKEQEILKIKEKNKRIRKILEDLSLPDDVYEPEMGSTEKPEMLLTTNDDEVKVEKYLTPEQWKKIEEDRKLEEERRMRERGDNWRERGLDQMMGGVLEIKKEDELKKDIPIPLFMQEKKEDDWSDDERRVAEEYQKKVKELEEERDKFRKQLEMELKKLQNLVVEGTQAFDDLLYQLFLKKVKIESVIFQEELKILRLRFSLLTEEEYMNYEKDLLQKLEKVKQSAQQASIAMNQAKKQMDEYRNDYDIHVADDKVHERMFRREFHDTPAQHVDQLFRHYKKRPRGQKAKPLEMQGYDGASSDPFFNRPSTAKRNEESRQALVQAMVELNNEKNIPDGIDNQTWEHLCNYRMEKIEKELQVKQDALILADMQAFVQKRQEEEEKYKNEIEEVIEGINKLRESRQSFLTNLEVQLLLKQGQVEVDPGSFIPNYKTTLLIHREVVEELNRKIRQLGESKITSMVESKDFRKGIVQLEWEHKKMMMEMEDLKNRMRDIINMKVTREIQIFLATDDYDTLKNQEIATLEQTIAIQKKHHERRVKEKKKQLKSVQRNMLHVLEKNDSLMTELNELNVTVNERQHIHSVNPEKLNDLDREGRYKDLVHRRKLVDLAKAQAEEIASLRTELERLRMRTFPALVQLDR